MYLLRQRGSKTAFSLLVLAATWGATPTLLAQTNALAQIEEAALAYLWALHGDQEQLGRRVELSVAPLDRRLRLSPCPLPLDVSLNGSPGALGRVQLKMHCRSDAPWSKFISAEVKLYAPVAVANGDLRRGIELAPEHVLLEERNLAAVRGTAITDPETLYGLSLKYPLTSGSPISMDRVEQPKLVHRGDLVQLIAQSETLLIKQQGEALQDGAIGKRISVRNSSSNTVVQAEVIARGQVKVSF